MNERRRKKGRWLGRDTRFGYLSIVPVLILMSFFSAGPLVYVLALSFQEYTLGGYGRPFVFMENYQGLVESRFFIPSLVNTFIFTIGAVVLVFPIALLFTLVLNEKFRANMWLKLTLLIPWAIPEIANALGWRWILDGNWGVLNGIMVYGLGIFDSYQSWLGNPNYAMGAILAPHVWKEVSLATILLLAGISTIPSSLYEAAKLDGANVLARFRRITLPMLRPIIQIILVYETIQGITSFAYVFVLTGGGPGYTTTTLSWLVWMTSFSFGDFGQGSSVAVIMSVIAILLTLLYFRLLPTKEFGAVTVR